MLLALLLLGSGQAGATQPCLDRVQPYAGWREAPGQAWDLSVPGAAIIGAQHSRDAADPQFARIKAGFDAAKPSLVLFEGPDRGVRETDLATIEGLGESGYVRWLAGQAKVPARSLEPSPIAQIATLKQGFSGDRIMLFFVLREAVRLRDREGMTGPELDAAVSAMLAKAAPLAGASGITTSVTDLASLEKASRAEWPNLDWRTAPAGWFTPLEREGTAAQFTNRINTADSDFRNRHLAQTIIDATARGERVFVVVGRNHVPMIAPALRCARER